VTSTLYLQIGCYPLPYGQTETLYYDIWLASLFGSDPSGSSAAPAEVPAGSGTAVVSMLGTAVSIPSLDTTKGYWLRVFNPQGYSHWFPVSWVSGNSSGAPQIVSVPAIEGPNVFIPGAVGPAGLDGRWSLDNYQQATVSDKVFSIIDISQTHDHLVLVGTVLGSGTGDQVVALQVNGDTSGAYDGAYAGMQSNAIVGGNYTSQDYWSIGDVSGVGTEGAADATSFTIWLPNYRNAAASAFDRTMHGTGQFSYELGCTPYFVGGRWKSSHPAPAITALTVYCLTSGGGFEPGSVVALYGF